MHAKANIIFDTSGLNALADDLEKGPIVKSLNVGFRVRLSETSICEIAGTSRPERRILLLGLCRHLVHAGEGILPFHEVFHRMSRAHAADPGAFDWRSVDVRCPELEDEIVRGTLIADQVIASDVKLDNKASNRKFEEMWREARAKFEPELTRGHSVRISIESVFEALEAEGSPLWQLASDLYKRGTNIELSRSEAKVFVNACPPAKAMLLAVCVGQYHWGLRDARAASKFGAGRLDLFSATYLPFGDRFITNDSGQYNALGLTGKRAGLTTEVCMYSDFRRSLLVAA